MRNDSPYALTQAFEALYDGQAGRPVITGDGGVMAMTFVFILTFFIDFNSRGDCIYNAYNVYIKSIKNIFRRFPQVWQHRHLAKTRFKYAVFRRRLSIL